MEIIEGDLLENSDDWDCAIHCSNLFHTFGAGIAYFIKRKYPEVYQADLETVNGCESKLGLFSKAGIEGNTRLFYNLYAQRGIGNGGHPLNRNLSYDHLYNGLWKIMEDIMKEYPFGCVVALPAWIGCGLAGGCNNIVKAIIEDVGSNFPDIEIVAYQLDNN